VTASIFRGKTWSLDFRSTAGERLMIEESAERRWDHLARSPVAWFDRASVLRECADIIGQRFIEGVRARGGVTEGVSPLAFGPVFQMLAGFALEALLKGIIVARTPEVIQRKYLRKDFITHDFDKLLALAGLSVDERRQKFLRRLGDAVVWMGKYPISTGAKDMKPVRHSSTGDLALFADLYDRFVRALQAASKKGSC
jgi:hypothetical protein